MIKGKLDGKVAVITGSGRGIGRAIALKFASEGAKIVVNDLDAEPAAATVAQIQELGAEAIACVGNVTAADFGERAVQSAIEAFKGLDIIVNNAGYTWDNVIQKMTDEQFQTMLDVHLVAPFRILRAAAEPIRAFAKQEAAQGREVYRKVVNISSVSGTMGNAGQVNYAAGKMGLIGVTKALAKEWGRYKVNVNAVAYGYIQTRLTRSLQEAEGTISIEGREIKVGMQEERIASANSSIPLGRGGTPEEAAGAVYMFCIPESNYVSGQTIICGGGHGHVF
ncbi:MAG TPA: SDR family NAD(P)-dependent oxidoreductase [Steroidobacteraceae bacterium]|nr:SDR family NAD(P)-dependent oxidoreductase [Steroidobacteraceae bacterium]